VGPVWHGGGDHEEQLLANAYRNSLNLAVLNDMRSIAFPNISTGVYHFPKDRAADIAYNTVREFVAEQPNELDEVIFVCFDDENYDLYASKEGVQQYEQQ
jgi:O-acetyl-ADP-ribose deacetylase (regulator of RNase III)